jgi:mandelate racemase
MKITSFQLRCVSAQLPTATPTARRLEYADWWNAVLQQPLRLREGQADIEGVPDSGIEFDEAAVARCLA